MLICLIAAPQNYYKRCKYFVLKPFQWRQWSRTPTWPCSSPVTAAILVSWRVCGRAIALIWTESSSSLQRRSLKRETNSKTSCDERTRLWCSFIFLFPHSNFCSIKFCSSSLHIRIFLHSKLYRFFSMEIIVFVFFCFSFVWTTKRPGNIWVTATMRSALGY